MCIFDCLDIRCNDECPDRIANLCMRSEDLQDVASLVKEAVSFACAEVAKEIRKEVESIDPENMINGWISPYESTEHIELRRDGVVMAKDDILSSIDLKIEEYERCLNECS